MKINHLEAAGLLPDWQETVNLLKAEYMRGLPPNEAWHHVAAYNDPSGVSLSFFGTKDGHAGESLTVHGIPRVSVKAWQPIPGLAELIVIDDDVNETTRVLAAVDDPHMYPVYPLNAVGEQACYQDYRIGAIAVDVDVYDDVDAWEQAQEPLNVQASQADDADNELLDDIYIGPEFVTSLWLLALYGGRATAEQANPISMFKAVCRSVDVVTNRLTGKQWYRIQADCSIPVTLALPITISPAPKVGSVIDGQALLTGTTGFWLDDFHMPHPNIRT